jgi:AbrB family looped-hinge helix DNA binding protein
VGDRGRLVIPAELRARSGLREGDQLVFVESPIGIVMLTREQLLARVREDLAGVGLVDDLLDERRRAAQVEDVE